MATGRSNQLIKQIGEYLVASEIARHGLLVATFSGNVPDFDLIATDSKGSSCPLQVKTASKGTWQFSVDKFADITFDGKKQIIGQPIPQMIPDLICVFVIAGDMYGEDQFFILEWASVQEIVIANHKRWLEAHGGVRPRKPESMHCTVTKADLGDFKNNWSLIGNRFVRMSPSS
jgi:hypothetical protein